MNRLPVRLFVTHVVVALVGAATTYVLVQLLAPRLFDSGTAGMTGMNGMGRGQGQDVRAAFASAINTALLIGLGIAVLTAATAGGIAAYRLSRPLEQVRAATRRLSQGHYDEVIPLPREVELAELARDVNSLGAALAQTEQRRVRLLSEVAHEMRTPLTVIDGYVEGMIDEVFPADPETLGEVSVEVGRLRRLAEDLSALSQAEEGRLDLRTRPMDLSVVGAHAAERLRPQLQDAGVGLIIAAAEEPLVVAGDSDRLGQVVTNLVGNALAATRSGGTVRVDTRRAGDRAMLSVTDTGVGLAADEVERVFERFYRAGGSTPRAGGGTGIGLTIARGIARAHGGDLTATSPGLGSGATFTLNMPIALAGEGGGRSTLCES